MISLVHRPKRVIPRAPDLTRQKSVALSQSWLDENIATLQRLATADHDTGVPSDIKQTINGVVQEVKEIRQYLETQLGIGFAPALPNELSTLKARQVFGTLELLELILLNLDMTDLVRVQLVNRMVHATISSSVRLQDLMFLRAEPSSYFRPLRLRPASNTAIFDCSPVRYHYRSANATPLKDDEVEIFATLEYDDEPPSIGERFRSLLISQPPVKQMQPVLSCCSPGGFWNRQPPVVDEPDPIQSVSGITLGDILDATQKLKIEHWRCPHARIYDHDEHGNVRCELSFRAVIRLQADDPFLAERQKKTIARLAREAEIGSFARRINPYIQAKFNGKACSIA